jgi:hypothetical protein
MKRTLIHIKQSGHNDSMSQLPHPGKISYTVSFDLRAIWSSGFALSQGIMWPKNGSQWNFWREDISAEHQIVVTITSGKHSVLLRFEHPSMLNGFTVIVGYCFRRPWVAVITHEAQESLQNLASSLDDQNAWPRLNYDRRRFQDRVEIDLGYSGLIEVTLQKAGVPHSYGPEKYWVKMNVKKRLYEKEDADSIQHTVDREGDIFLEGEAAEVETSEQEDHSALGGSLPGQHVVTRTSGAKEPSATSQLPLEHENTSNMSEEREAISLIQSLPAQENVSTGISV